MDRERQHRKTRAGLGRRARHSGARDAATEPDTTKVEDPSRRWLIARTPTVLEMQHIKHVAVLVFERTGPRAGAHEKLHVKYLHASTFVHGT
jgi:hypothetical protein